MYAMMSAAACCRRGYIPSSLREAVEVIAQESCLVDYRASPHAPLSACTASCEQTAMGATDRTRKPIAQRDGEASRACYCGAEHIGKAAST